MILSRFLRTWRYRRLVAVPRTVAPLMTVARIE
jgi:hypothetical protein